MVLTRLISMFFYLALGCGFYSSATHAQTNEVNEATAAVDEASSLVTADDASVAMLQFINSPWIGDFDGMLERGLIRALVVPSKTMYFEDKGGKKGISSELLNIFEQHINKKYPPKVKHIKTYVAFIPVKRDQLIPALLEGRGDIAVDALTITPDRLKVADFSEPFFHNIDEIIVTGPASTELNSLDDLSGQELFVRRSSSYWEHLEQLNARFKAEERRR